MKILWSVNLLPPEIAGAIGTGSGNRISWVDAMLRELAKNPENKMYIVSPGGKKVDSVKKHEEGGITYYALPMDGTDVKAWETVINEVKPDVMHLYGTEKLHNETVISRFKNDYPILISLQGIITEYIRYYYAGISMWDILSHYTIKDIIRGGIIKGKKRFEKQSVHEKRMLQNVKYVEGRSEWDKVISRSINPVLEYFYCPRMIRRPFYEHMWDYEKVEKHSLFVHQGNYPIKGFHYLLEAVNILKKDYPDLKLYISGSDVFSAGFLRKSGYINYIKDIIHTNKLEDHITFTGFMDAEELAEKLETMNVCVIPSAIENAPNALAEAMLVGTPCVASYAGGNAEMLNYDECGFVYRYDEPDVLAYKIKTLFENPELANEKSVNARRLSHKRHDPETLVKTITGIYRTVVDDFNSKKGKRD